jgi:DNA-binding MarR family transcriptional regulator
MSTAGSSVGPRNPQTALGQALRGAWWSYVRRIDAEMRAAGFGERRFPMIYLFALYTESRALTISEIGRRFAISRQAASKIVRQLGERGYLSATQSKTDRREKVVELTPRAIEYIAARRRAASALDTEIQARIGDAGLDQLHRLLQVAAQTASDTTRFDPSDFARSPELM